MCWIKIWDQMPEIGEKVDIWHKHLNVRSTDAELGYKDGELVFILPNARVIPVHDVTHWRYPPAPPTGAASA